MTRGMIASLFVLIIGSTVLASDPPAGQPVDINAIRKDTYDVQLSGQIGTWIVPGTGVDMSDPYTPDVVANSPFAVPGAAAPGIEAAISSADLTTRRVTVTTAFHESISVEEEASLLAASFRMTYPFIGSASAAFRKVEESRRSGKAVYFVFTISENAAAVPPAQLTWPQASLDTIEGLDDRNLRVRMLASKYGTHFVQSVEYGARLVVRAEIRTTDLQRQQELSTKVKLAIAAFSAGGQVDSSTREALSTRDVSINAEVTAAAIKPGSHAMVLTSLDDVANFFAKFKSNEIQLVPGPISAKVRSYWSTIDRKVYPRLFDDLSPALLVAAPSPYGVPPGTIIAWSPRPGDIIDSADGRIILPPEGWLVCDGTRDTPDLRNRFIMGTTSVSSLLTTTGHETIKPSASVNFAGYRRGEINYDQGAGRVSDFQMNYSADISPISLVPPSVYCVFIMKQ